MPGWSIRVNPVSLIFLAFAMSTDAFAAAIGKGSSLDRPRLSEALRTGIIFGVIEAITPLVGWLLGQAASQFVADWDHWIAFVLLVLLGLHMIHNGLRADHATEQEKPGQHSFWILAVTALATSIDALAVGVTMAFMDVDILLSAGIIGAVAFVLSMAGGLLGRRLGCLFQRRAEILGGLVLMGIGIKILVEHLTLGG